MIIYFFNPQKICQTNSLIFPWKTEVISEKANERSFLILEDILGYLTDCAGNGASPEFDVLKEKLDKSHL